MYGRLGLCQVQEFDSPHSTNFLKTGAMKTLSDLMQLVAVAIERNNEQIKRADGTTFAVNGHFFVNFSGHVQKLSIDHYRAGWDRESRPDKCDVILDESGIQEAYWFIKNRI